MLEIVTRHLTTRPTMLERNQASVDRYADEDVMQTLIVDNVGRGVAWANEQMAEFTPVADYVWLLDDDDEAVCPHLPECLTRIVEQTAPDLVMVQMDHGQGVGVLPSGFLWGSPPQEGRIGCSAFITSKEHWMECRGAWTSRYAGDSDFVRAAYALADEVVWHKCVVSKCQRANSNGAPE